MTKNDYNPEDLAAKNAEMIKIHRRCNDAELSLLKQSFNHAIDVLLRLNQEKAVQISNVK